MTIPELIAACERRIVWLQQLRASYNSLGDIKQVERTDSEIAETQDTLNKLRTVV